MESLISGKYNSFLTSHLFKNSNHTFKHVYVYLHICRCITCTFFPHSYIFIGSYYHSSLNEIYSHPHGYSHKTIHFFVHTRQPYNAFHSCTLASIYIYECLACNLNIAPLSMSFLLMGISNSHILPPRDLTTLLMTSLI